MLFCDTVEAKIPLYWLSLVERLVLRGLFNVKTKIHQTSVKKFLLHAACVIGLLATACVRSYAGHIIGGEITYRCLGFTGNDSMSKSRRYRFTMKIYRDCLSAGSQLDSSPGSTTTASVTIYAAGQANRPTVFYLPAPKTTRIQPDPGNKCVDVPQNVCVEEGLYDFETDLSILEEPYIITYQRCCRNNTITNIRSPERSGATYTVELSAEAQKSCNNSPVFRFFPPIALCAGLPFSVDHSGTDTEGDSLVYELCPSLLGGGENTTLPTSGTGIAPDPDLPPPYTAVNYVTPTYGSMQPLGASSRLQINPQTGALSGTPMQMGQFVVGVCMSEYRKGQLLTRVLRDFQFNITRCDANVVANPGTDSVNASGQFLLQQCGPTQVTLTNKSAKREFITAFRWEFDTPTGTLSSAEWDGKFAFSTPGMYSGRLLLNPGLQCADTALIALNVLPSATADFGISTDTCRHQPMAFENRSNTGGRAVKSYTWDFGDGTPTDATASPTHLFGKTGVFQVKMQLLTVDGCKGEVQKRISYFPLPASLSIQAALASGCSPLKIAFQNSPLGDFKTAYQLRWDFGDGGTAAVEQPAYTYSQPGLYPVRLQLTSTNGCRAEAQLANPIRILQGTVARFDYDPKQLNSQNATVRFTDQSEQAKSWSWAFGTAGVSSVQSPVFTFPPGQHRVRLITDAGNGCTDTTEQNLIVESLYRLYWPSIFSPNGDGVNDIFLPGGDLTGLQDYKIWIVSRWGSSVFESANPSDGWNGKSQNTGAELPAGVYFYRATMKDVLGSALQYEGTITLIR
ncbi:MAG: hypothetical protein RL181_767 [Bacteroidota bacterium]